MKKLRIPAKVVAYLNEIQQTDKLTMHQYIQLAMYLTAICDYMR